MTMSRRRLFGIGGVSAAAAIALTLSGSAAWAHHCFKDEWAAAAYEHHLAGGTPWVPLSDLGARYLIPEDLQMECGYVADDAVETFMADNGLEQEPLIHTRAIVGGGALYNAGKIAKPFSYLTEADFEALGADLMERLAECAGEE